MNLSPKSILTWVAWLAGAGLAFIVAVVLLVALAIHFSHPDSGVNLSSVPWLDSRASDIAFYKGNDFGGNFYYEFRISLKDFQALARERSWHLTKPNRPYNMPRYFFFLPDGHKDKRGPLDVTIEDYYYSLRADNGGGITVGYNVAAGRGYVSQSSR